MMNVHSAYSTKFIDVKCKKEEGELHLCRESCQIKVLSLTQSAVSVRGFKQGVLLVKFIPGS